MRRLMPLGCIRSGEKDCRIKELSSKIMVLAEGSDLANMVCFIIKSCPNEHTYSNGGVIM